MIRSLLHKLCFAIILFSLIIMPFGYAFPEENPQIIQQIGNEVTLTGGWGKVTTISGRENVISKSHKIEHFTNQKGGFIEKFFDKLSIIKTVRADTGNGCCIDANQPDKYCTSSSALSCCGLMDCPGDVFDNSTTNCNNLDTECAAMGCCIIKDEDDCTLMEKQECYDQSGVNISEDFIQQVCDFVPSCELIDCLYTDESCSEDILRANCVPPDGSVVSDCSIVVPEYGNITGYVYDSATNQPINDALVRVMVGPTLIHAIETDGSGYFEFLQVSPGDYSLKVSASGYDENTTSITVIDQQNTNQDIYLVENVNVRDISGMVFNQTGLGLAGVYVYVEGYAGNLDSMTDQNGFYFLQNVPEGDFIVWATKEGFKTNSTTIYGTTDLLNRDIHLYPETGLIGECGDSNLDDGEACDPNIPIGSPDYNSAGCPSQYCFSDCSCPTSCSAVGGYVCEWEDLCTDGGGTLIPENFGGFSKDYLIFPTKTSPPYGHEQSHIDLDFGYPGEKVCCDQPCLPIYDCLGDRKIEDSSSLGFACKCGDYYFHTLEDGAYYCCDQGDGTTRFSIGQCGNLKHVDGTVVDDDTSAPISSVLMIFYETDGSVFTTTSTNEDGEYSVFLNGNRNYDVAIYGGDRYEEFEERIEIQNDDETINFRLIPTNECFTNPIVPAEDFTATIAEQGEPYIQLRWDQPCSLVVEMYQISRSANGGPFQVIKVLTSNQANSFVDRTALWGTDYRYELKTITSTSDATAYVSVYTGDAICAGVTDEICTDVNHQRNSQLVYRMRCGADNTLTWAGTDLDSDCLLIFGGGGVCIDLGDGTTQCTLNQQCDKLGLGKPSNQIGKNVFGLYYDYQYGNINCTYNFTSSTRRYCYYDYSSTSVDACKSCNSEGSCFDYLSEDACIKDNCGYGSKLNTTCQYYKNISHFQELGIGVCYPVNYTGTDHCADCGESAGLFRNKGCSDDLCNFLGNCFSTDDECHMCQSTRCSDLNSIAQCEGIGNGFQISNFAGGACGSSDTFVESDDACSIGKCEWFSSLGECAKNADDDTEPDCADETGEAACEGDTDGPVTMIFPPGYVNIQGKELSFEVDDAMNNNPFDTYYCFSQGCECCPTNGYSLSGNNGNPSVTLSSSTSQFPDTHGEFNVYYYSEDKYDNVELIQNSTIYVDTHAPEVSIDNIRIAEAWHPSKSFVYINLSVEDNVSGISHNVFCTFTFSGQGVPTSVHTYTVENTNHLVQLEYLNLDMQTTLSGYDDGTYTFEAVCRDAAYNYGNLTETIEINRYNVLGMIMPNTTITESQLSNTYNGQLIMNSSTLFSRCIWSDDGISETMTTSNIQPPYQYFTRQNAITTTDTSYGGMIYCFINDPGANPDLGTADAKKTVSFTVDATGPSVDWKYEQDGTRYDFVETDIYSIVDSGELLLVPICNDPDINVTIQGQEMNRQYPYGGEFGCDRVEVCVSTSPCSQVGSCTNYEEKSQVSITTDNACVFYRSYDVGENPGDEGSFDVMTDSNNPIVTITNPFTGLSINTRTRTITYEASQHTGSTEINLIVRTVDAEIPESTRYTQTIPETSTGGTFTIDLYNGTNQIMIILTDSTHDGGQVGYAEDEIVLYRDLKGPELTNAKIFNGDARQIDNSTDGDYVSGFFDNLTFNINADDPEYCDIRSNIRTDISNVTVTINASYGQIFGPYRMENISQEEYKYVFDPSVQGYILKGNHTVIYLAYDNTLEGPNNPSTLKQEFRLEENITYQRNIYDDDGTRIYGSRFAEMGSYLIFNGTVSNGAYVDNIDMHVYCNESYITDFDEDYQMNRSLTNNAIFYYNLTPTAYTNGTFDLGPGKYVVEYTITDLDNQETNFTDTFLIDDTTFPNVTVTILTNYTKNSLPVITKGHDGSVIDYYVKINSSEPVNVTNFQYNIRGRTGSLTGRNPDMNFGNENFTMYWTYTLTIPIDNPNFDNIDTSSRFQINLVDQSGNSITESRLYSGRDFWVDTYGGRKPNIVPDIPQDLITNSTPLFINGSTFNDEVNMTIHINLSYFINETTKEISTGETRSTFNTTIGFDGGEGHYNLTIYQEDFLGNLGEEYEREIIYDITPFEVYNSDPKDGEAKTEVRTISIILYDNLSGIDRDSIQFFINGTEINRTDFTVYTTYSLQNGAEIQYRNREGNFENGEYSIEVRGRNNAGIYTSIPMSFIVDDSMPGKPELELNANYYAAPLDTWYTNQINGHLFRFNYTQETSLIEIANFTLRNRTDTIVGNCIRNSNTTFNCTLSNNLSEGDYSIVLESRKELQPGNWSNPQPHIWDLKVDLTPPVITLNKEIIYTQEVDNIAEGTFQGLLTDGHDYIRIHGDLASEANATMINSRVFKGNFTLIGDGREQYIVYFTGVDKAGNTHSDNLTVIHDTSASNEWNVNVTANFGHRIIRNPVPGGLEFITNAGSTRNALQITGEAEPGKMEFFRSYSGGGGFDSYSKIGEVNINPDGSFAFNITSLQAPDGENRIKMVLTDLAENNATYIFKIFSDTNGIESYEWRIEFGGYKAATVGSTHHPGVTAPADLNCDTYGTGSVGYDACQLNLLIYENDQDACSRITNTVLHNTCNRLR